ncbi:hypothetical protein RSAG8_05186, partial [Rhizoctonia solani AG-8 WAC10335]
MDANSNLQLVDSPPNPSALFDSLDITTGDTLLCDWSTIRIKSNQNVACGTLNLDSRDRSPLLALSPGLSTSSVIDIRYPFLHDALPMFPCGFLAQLLEDVYSA